MFSIYQPLRAVFGLDPLEGRFYDGSDHIAFSRAGVPGYSCTQAPAQYREVHHSQSDTFDKVIPEEINQGAAVLASWMWNVSEYPVALPHHATSPQEDSLGAPSP
jgi:Zn-dependent M28 family amino/carboxypeptidase